MTLERALSSTTFTTNQHHHHTTTTTTTTGCAECSEQRRYRTLPSTPKSSASSSKPSRPEHRVLDKTVSEQTFLTCSSNTGFSRTAWPSSEYLSASGDVAAGRSSVGDPRFTTPEPKSPSSYRTLPFCNSRAYVKRKNLQANDRSAGTTTTTTAAATTSPNSRVRTRSATSARTESFSSQYGHREVLLEFCFSSMPTSGRYHSSSAERRCENSRRRSSDRTDGQSPNGVLYPSKSMPGLCSDKDNVATDRTTTPLLETRNHRQSKSCAFTFLFRKRKKTRENRSPSPEHHLHQHSSNSVARSAPQSRGRHDHPHRTPTSRPPASRQLSLPPTPHSPEPHLQHPSHHHHHHHHQQQQQRQPQEQQQKDRHHNNKHHHQHRGNSHTQPEQPRHHHHQEREHPRKPSPGRRGSGPDSGAPTSPSRPPTTPAAAREKKSQFSANASRTDLENESHYTSSGPESRHTPPTRSQSLPNFEDRGGSSGVFLPNGADTRVISDAEDFVCQPSVDMKGPLHLSLCGCGFLGMYHLGVVSCMAQRGPAFLERVDKVCGASAGALMAAVLVTSSDKMVESGEHVQSLAREIRRKPLGALTPGYSFTRSLRAMLEDILPEDAHRQARGKLHVSLTNAASRKNELMSDFRSREELIEALIASCYIPVYAGIKMPTLRGKKYMDGGLSNNLPKFETGRTVTVSPFDGKSDIGPKAGQETEKKAHFINVHNQDFQALDLCSDQVNFKNFKRGAHAFFPPRRGVLQDYFDKGRYDASRFLIREGLYEITIPSQSQSVLYESSV